MKKLLGILIFLLVHALLFSQTKFVVSGYVTDALKEELIGANIFIKELEKGAITNTYGFYSLTLPKGTYHLVYSFVGCESQEIAVELSSNKQINIALEESSRMIESVQITAEGPDVNVAKNEMSTVQLPMKTVQKLPSVMGESDILKTIQLLPGVLMASEISGGFYVRGGSSDQNLILLDNAPVYNASHLVGFFSVFNTDAIKDLKLYKGGIPSEFGGRLSSILDIHMKEGNKNEFHGSAGIGTISSRLNLEGPIIKNKASFLLTGRRSYADLMLPFSKDSLAKKSKLFFYDLNAKINYAINENNRIFLSGYFGRDVTKMGDLINMDYGNFTITNRWNHVFNKKVFLDVSSIYSSYRFSIGMEEGISKYTWETNIRDLNQKFDFTYYLNPGNTIKFGVQGIYHDFLPGTIFGQFDDTTQFDYTIPNVYSLEYAVYASNEMEVTPNLSIQYGIRYSFFQNIGKGQSFVFDKSDPQLYDATDTFFYSKGKIYNTFDKGFEPRLSVRYKLNDESSVKASYNRMIQYIHLASNSTASLPMNFWFPSSPNIKPQISDQIALGYFRNFHNNMFETSVEVYYKWMKNSIDFRDHAQLLLNDKYEGELRVGNARSYGVEFFVKKQTGKLTGWISYTYSKTYKKIPEINNGEEYQAAHDKPHDFALVLSYDLTKKLNVSGNWVYTSAPPRTMPTSRFEYGGMIAPAYSDRNTIRIFPYHRMDISATYRLNKIESKIEHSLNLSVYNVYAHKNPLMITFSQDEDNKLVTKATMTYLYSIVPSLTYNVTF